MEGYGYHWYRVGGLDALLLAEPELTRDAGQLRQAGLGLLLQPMPLVRDAIEARQLVRLLPDHAPLPRPMHILDAPDRRITPKLRSFLDFVAAHFG